MVGGPPFVLPGPLMSGDQADYNEGVFKEPQKPVFLRSVVLLLYVPLQISLAE